MARLRAPRSVITALLATTVLLLAACGGDDTPTTGDGGDDAGGEEAVALEVSAVDNSFEPSSLSAPAGSEVTIDITNDGENPHTLTIDDPEVDTSTIEAGQSATVTFTMPDSSIEFYCAIHGANAMAGTIEAS